ncbi:MAG: hypothetical protein JWO59_3213, partial [Chloroflexi bacterium]|nr:hypothetical protein [Chloroflexota bacterium]
VEDFGDPAYYEGQLPQGATAITVDNPADREAEVRSTMMQAGALQLQGHGVEGRPTGMTELIDAEAPTPVRGGERAPDDSDELSIRSPSNEFSTGLHTDSTGGRWEAGDSETTEEPSYSENLRGHARH